MPNALFRWQMHHRRSPATRWGHAAPSAPRQAHCAPMVTDKDEDRRWALWHPPFDRHRLFKSRGPLAG